jgi:hypothetical protein
VFALFEDDLSSDLYLHISPQGKATSFAMDLTPSFKAAQAVITAAEKLPAREIVREFTGSVQDSWGGMITEANIKVVRKGSADKANVLRLKSDANGHFSAQLTEGAYVAFFSSPGFRTEIVPFEVAALRREGNVGQVADWERIPIDEGEHLELNASTHSQGCAGSHDSHYLVRKFREDDGRVERVVAPDRESRSLHSRVDSRSESTGSVGMTGLGVDRNDRALK